MLEPWANTTLQERMIVACNAKHKKYKCNACDRCQLNVKFLHTPDTDPREIVYTMAQTIGEERRAKIQIVLMLLAAAAVLYWLFYVFILNPEYVSEHSRVQLYVQEMNVHDVDRNGRINCVDYAVTLWRKNKKRFELLYIPAEEMKGGVAHLTVVYQPYDSNSPYIIEAQGRGNIDFKNYWGFTPTKGYIVTHLWNGWLGKLDYQKAYTDGIPVKFRK